MDPAAVRHTQIDTQAGKARVTLCGAQLGEPVVLDFVGYPSARQPHEIQANQRAQKALTELCQGLGISPVPSLLPADYE